MSDFWIQVYLDFSGAYLQSFRNHVFVEKMGWELYHRIMPIIYIVKGHETNHLCKKIIIIRTFFHKINSCGSVLKLYFFFLFFILLSV